MNVTRSCPWFPVIFEVCPPLVETAVPVNLAHESSAVSAMAWLGRDRYRPAVDPSSPARHPPVAFYPAVVAEVEPVPSYRRRRIARLAFDSAPHPATFVQAGNLVIPWSYHRMIFAPVIWIDQTFVLGSGESRPSIDPFCPDPAFAGLVWAGVFRPQA